MQLMERAERIRQLSLQMGNVVKLKNQGKLQHDDFARRKQVIETDMLRLCQDKENDQGVPDDPATAYRKKNMRPWLMKLEDDMTHLAVYMKFAEEYLIAGEILQDEYDRRKKYAEAQVIMAFYRFMRMRFDRS